MRREDQKKITQKRRHIINHLLDLEGVLDYLIVKQVVAPTVRGRINLVSKANFFNSFI